jgi:transposase
MTAHVCGIDIGKTVFHLIGLSKEGQIVIKKRFTRKQLITHMANMPACLIGMEACPGAHFLARVLRAQGHEVKLMPAEYVRPFVKSNKNDYVDAEAIAEAVQRPTMRFVPIKSEAQLDLQALHRVRDRWMGRRTAVINQIRGFLLEHGITVAVGPAHLKRQIPFILEDADNLLSPRMRALLIELRDEWEKLETQIENIDREFAQAVKKEENCRRLLTIPGIGPSQRPRLPQPAVTLRPFTKAVIWQPGSVWFRASIQQAAKQDFSALANVAIPICDGFLSMEVEPWSHA